MPNHQSSHAFKTFIFTVFALIAFAANSVLARLALMDGNIDPLSFTTLRLASGAIMLCLLLSLRPRTSHNKTASHFTLKGSMASALCLFVYALCFSIAYLSLETGTGALILFGAVQITMIVYQLCKGHKLVLLEWLGITLAFAGFVYLMLPNASTPSFSGFVLMALAGMAWAGYTIRGKTSSDPLSDTTGNFVRCLPLCLLLIIYIMVTENTLTYHGMILAIISGAVTSGMGYAIWYVALKGLKATQAGVVQLLVPVIAALGGAIMVREPITLPFVVASAMILLGILLVTLQKR
ncbi:DMT family transporter [Vibrio gangliei]|uniref:DMT family transporter n=1 Tax=Vibrio gangliei TaxID=2077090 RepID=UPI000D019887|nr:DMT family transporter [Vibrio gangliei]